MENFRRRDALEIMVHMRRHEKHISKKRKFLMGSLDARSSDQIARLLDGKMSAMPESFLRKDDVFYEDLKMFVEKGFRACDAEARQSLIGEDVEICDVHNISSFILTLLDDLSNNGLWSLAKILTSGSMYVNKTRPQMKRLIKCSLRELRSNCPDQIQNQLSQLLRNPNNFCQNHSKYIKLTRTTLLHVLDKVNFQSLPVRILSAMLRKLKGTQRFTLQVAGFAHKTEKGCLSNRVFKLCKKMINQNNDSNELQSLVKALAVPSLYSKIASNYQDLTLAKFVQLPPEVEELQNEIVNAIQTLKQSLKKEELKHLQLLLDPEFKFRGKYLRRSFKILLIDCLFGCNDMEAVPDSLLKALSYLKKKACKTRLLKEVIEEEVERILDVGAHVRQLMWDSIPLHQLDQDFADAYMEEHEETDDGDIFDYDDQQLHTGFLDEAQSRFNDCSEVASTRDAHHAIYSSATSRSRDEFGNANEVAFSSSFKAATFTDQDVFRDTEISGCQNSFNVCSKVASTRDAHHDETNESSFSSSFKAANFTDQDGLRDTEISGGQMNSTRGGDGQPPLFSPTFLVKDEVMGDHGPPNNTSVDAMNLGKKCSKQNQASECPENRYLAVQKVCDQSSLVAYQLIGHVLAEFGQMEALGLSLENESYLRGAISRSENFQDSNLMDEDVRGSIIVQAVNEVLPSFPSSQLKKLKEFMSL